MLPQNKDQHRVGVGGVCGAGAWRAQQLLSWRCQGLTELGSRNKRVARGWVSGLCLLVGAVTAIATILIYFFPGSCDCYGAWAPSAATARVFLAVLPKQVILVKQERVPSCQGLFPAGVVLRTQRY